MYSRTFGDWRAHNGIDIAATAGCSVMAIGDGTVQSFTEDVMLGGVLVIRHGDLDVYYCGLGSNPSVKAGDTVRCGQVVGILKDIPSETVEDAHLHIQVQRDGKWDRAAGCDGKRKSTALGIERKFARLGAMTEKTPTRLRCRSGVFSYIKIGGLTEKS